MRGPTLSDHLSHRSNGVGFLRLVLAFAVLLSHGVVLGGFNQGREPLQGLGRNRLTLGEVAVVGFFALSGMLLTNSWIHRPRPLGYLRNRVLRLMPAYWVCLVLTALVMAPIAWHGSRSGAFPLVRGPASALGYLFRNAGLQIRQAGIGGLFDRNPFPLAVNGSLWTLFYEAQCYVGLLVVGMLGLLNRRRRWVVVLVALVALAVNAFAAQAQRRLVLPLGFGFQTTGFRVGAAFLVGVVVCLFADVLPTGWLVGAVSGGLAVVALATGLGDYGGLVPVAVFCLWLGIRLPLRDLERHGDISYGLYLYAFPIQQLLALYGWNRWGYVAYVALTTIFVVGLAALSWALIERPAMRIRSTRAPRTPIGVAPAPTRGEQRT